MIRIYAQEYTLKNIGGTCPFIPGTFSEYKYKDIS